MRNGKTRPLAWQPEKRVPSGGAVTHTNSIVPVAIEVFKRNRWCCVAKIVPLDRQPVLAIVHRNQHGVSTAISVPLSVLAYAERRGCTWLCLRRDEAGEMWRLPLSKVRTVGWLGPGSGVEWYVRIADMQAIPWRPWPFATEKVQLGEQAKSDRDAIQPELFGEATA